jgi:hypothetical protein
MILPYIPSGSSRGKPFCISGQGLLAQVNGVASCGYYLGRLEFLKSVWYLPVLNYASDSLIPTTERGRLDNPGSPVEYDLVGYVVDTHVRQRGPYLTSWTHLWVSLVSVALPETVHWPLLRLLCS